LPVSVTSPGWCVKAVIHFEVRTDLGGSISFGYCIPLNRCTQNRRVKETLSFCPWSFAPHRLTRTRRGLCCCWCQYGLVPWFLLPTPQPSLAVVSRPSLSRSKNGNLLIILVVSPAFEAELSTHTTPRETTASCLIGDCVAVLRLPCTRLLNSEWWGAWLSSTSSIFIFHWSVVLELSISFHWLWPRWSSTVLSEYPESSETGAHTLRNRGEAGEKLASSGSVTGGHVRKWRVHLPSVIGER